MAQVLSYTFFKDFRLKQYVCATIHVSLDTFYRTCFLRFQVRGTSIYLNALHMIPYTFLTYIPSLKSLNLNTSIHTNLPNEIFYIKSFELCTLHCVMLKYNYTKCTGSALSIPAADCSQQILRRNKVSACCYPFACLVFWAHYVNVFVTDFTVNYVVTRV